MADAIEMSFWMVGWMVHGTMCSIWVKITHKKKEIFGETYASHC